MSSSEFAKLLGADEARIWKSADGYLFLIIGQRRHTSQDVGRWIKNGKPIDFSYLEEKVVASGADMQELEASAREYKRIGGLTMDEYIKERIGAR